MTAKNLTNLTTDDLAKEVARREAEAQREQRERAQQLEAARKAWAAQTWAQHAQTEEKLQECGQRAREQFTAAVQAADLLAAFAAWMDERSARYARESARNKVVQAGTALGERVDHIPDLRWYDPDFLKRLEEEADKHARTIGYDLADEIVPDAPTEVE